MTEHTALAYNLLVIEANRLGRHMRILHDQVKADMGAVLDDLYDGELDELSEKLFGIAAVLQLIGETPNANINPEGMEAIRSVVEDAAKIDGSDWAKETFDGLESLMV